MKTKPAAEEVAKETPLENKLFRLSREAIEAFDVLKARQGPRSGPRLIAEAIDLLLVKYGEKPIGSFRPVQSASTRAIGQNQNLNNPDAFRTLGADVQSNAAKALSGNTTARRGRGLTFKNSSR